VKLFQELQSLGLNQLPFTRTPKPLCRTR